jgi:hypothetical protein
MAVYAPVVICHSDRTPHRCISTPHSSGAASPTACAARVSQCKQGCLHAKLLNTPLYLPLVLLVVVAVNKHTYVMAAVMHITMLMQTKCNQTKQI